MAGKEGEESGKTPAASGGADYEAAYRFLKAGRVAEAEAILRKILTSDPDDAGALHLLGGIALGRGRIAAAEDLVRKAIRTSPRTPEYHDNLGAVLLRQGKTDEAIATFRTAIELDTGAAMTHNNLGDALKQKGDFEGAAAAFGRAIELEPDIAEVHSNLGIAYRGLGMLDQALACHRQALAIDPNYSGALYNLGNVLKDMKRLDEAAASYRRALLIKPDFAAALTHLGNVLRLQEKLEEAQTSFERAIRIDPDYLPAQTNLALLCLLIGDFSRAWEFYTARRSVRDLRRKLWQEPLPDDLSGKRILLLKEQGLGDEIFFLRFAAEVKRRGAVITYVAGTKIRSIIARLSFIDRVIGEGDEPKEVDFTVSVSDLPLVVEMKSAADIPPPYPLPGHPKRAARMEARLKRLGPPPYAGVTWRAGVKDEPDRLFKEVPLERLAGTLKQVSGTLLALQRNPEVGEIDQLSAGFGRPVHDFTALNDDLEDMLALLSLIDDYVTVSNTNVHLRAGTGRTSRVLVPNPPEYRWMAEGDESPWFPGCTVYRQRVDGDWDRAFAALARDLAEAFGV